APKRLLADQDRISRGLRLQPRRRVHDVPGDHSLSFFRPGVQGHDRLAGVDGDPDLEVETRILCVHLTHCVTDPKGGPDGSLRIVPVSQWSSEHAHDRVADELLDCAAEGLDVLTERRVVRPEDGPDVLRVEMFGSRGEPHQIGEQNRHDPAFFTGRPFLRTWTKVGPAGSAELEVERARGPARLTREDEPGSAGPAEALPHVVLVAATRARMPLRHPHSTLPSR